LFSCMGAFGIGTRIAPALRCLPLGLPFGRGNLTATSSVIAPTKKNSRIWAGA
jgi:hypothetical protein